LEARGEEDGGAGGGEFGAGGGGEGDELVRGVEVGEHEGEGFGVAFFEGAETIDGGGEVGADSKMEAAETFEGEDFAGEEEIGGEGEGVSMGGARALREARMFRSGGKALRCNAAKRFGAGVVEGDLGAAVGAADGLGVEAAVGGVFVFFGAGGAHFEGCHGGVFAVVRDVFDDGEARAAVGAVDEGMEVAAVGGVEHFAEAVGAEGGVGGDGGKC
jgi:hypothetical protein